MQPYSESNQKSSIPEILSIWPKIMDYTGISEYEAKTYLCLIALGSGSARKLSLISGIPRTKIYGTLKKLIDLSLVVEVSGNPSKYVPLSPDAFRPLMRMLYSRVEDFKSVFKILSEAHDAMKTTSSPRGSFVWYLDSYGEILDKCKDLLKGSEHEVLIVADDDGVALLFNVAHRVLDDLKMRMVDVKLYSPLDPKSDPLARELSYIFEVRRVEFTGSILFICADKEEFLLATIGSSGNYLEEAIFSDDLSLIKLIFLTRIEGLRGLETLPFTKLSTT
jgi:sugar-specific transcriptional regulator TrmB